MHSPEFLDETRSRVLTPGEFRQRHNFVPDTRRIDELEADLKIVEEQRRSSSVAIDARNIEMTRDFLRHHGLQVWPMEG